MTKVKKSPIFIMCKEFGKKKKTLRELSEGPANAWKDA